MVVAATVVVKKTGSGIASGSLGSAARAGSGR